MDTREFENSRWKEMRQPKEFRHYAALSLVLKAPVLDVGCGDGLLLSMLAEKGLAAEGADLSEVAVQCCKEKGLTASVADFTNSLPYKDASFSTVIALDVLEHVYDPQTVLGEMLRASSRYVVIGVPNFSSLPARLQVLLGRVPENNRPNKGHIYWFNWKVLTSLIRKNKLHMVTFRANAPWGRVPVLGVVTKKLAHLFPNLFALSFVVLCEK